MSWNGRPALLLAVLALLVLVSAVLLAADGRQQQVRRRVATLGAPAAPEPDGAPTNIRRARTAVSRRLTHLVLAIPDPLPPSFPLAPWLVSCLATMIAGLAACALTLFQPLWVAVLAGVLVWVLGVRGLFGWQHRTYADKLFRQLPDTIELVVSAVRAGLPVSEALRSVAREMPSPTREEFAQVCNEITVGTLPDVAIRALHRRTGLTEYGIFSVTLAVQSRSGGRLAETIQNLAETTRQRVALVGRARALAAEAKLSAIALGVLPILAAGGLSVMQPGYLGNLLHDPAGRRLLGIGTTTLALGALTMRWMIRKSGDA